MVKTVDLTKVSVDAKSMVWMCVAFSLVLLAYGVGQFGAGKLKEILKGASSAVAETTEDF